VKTAELTLALVLALAACREVPQAPVVTPPPPPTSVTVALDTILGPYLDVSDQWGEPALFVGSDQSVHVITMNNWNSLQRYHGCASQCDHPALWFAATADTFTNDFGSGGWYTGAVLAADGFHAVRTVTVYGYYGPTILYEACPGDCDIAAHWSVSYLFVGHGWMPGQPWLGGGQPLASDASGALHLLFFDAGSFPAWQATLAYARCTAACGDSANWRETVLDSSRQVNEDEPKLIAAAPDGGVHVFYAKGATLIHASCAAGCAAPAWQSGAIPGIALPGGPGTFFGVYVRAVSLAFGPGGALDLAYLDGLGGLAFATCAAPCTSPGSWSTTSLPFVTSDVSLAADRAGTLYLATIDTAGPAVSRCAADCLAPASWKTTPISSAVRGYRSRGKVAVAVDSAGHVLVASTTGWGPEVLQYSRLLP